jgi:hypothetical protein
LNGELNVSISTAFCAQNLDLRNNHLARVRVLYIVMESLVRQTNGIFGIGQMNDALAIQKGNVGTLI